METMNKSTLSLIKIEKVKTGGKMKSPGNEFFKDAPEGAKVEKLLVASIHNSTVNPRDDEKPWDLQELGESIKTQGLLQPIMVRRRKGTANVFEVICGNRRLQAHRLAELKWIDAQIVEATDDQAREMAIVENLQRKDLPAMDEAEAFKKLAEKAKKKGGKK